VLEIFATGSPRVVVPLRKTACVIAGFEVLTAVIMKSPIFWIVTSCSSEEAGFFE
jgi:hypothetical protein